LNRVSIIYPVSFDC